MQLAAIQSRLETLLAPRQEQGFFARLWGLTQEPLALQSEALSELLNEVLPSNSSKPTRGPALRPNFQAARRELEANVEALAALSGSRDHPPFAYVTWLWRVAQALERLEHDGWLEPSPKAPMPRADAARTQSFRAPFYAAPLLVPLPSGPALSGLAFSPLLDLANRETRQLGRRRRLLEAARRVLLETAATMATPPAGVEPHMLAITEQIRQINQWQADGVDPGVAVAHQLRRAVGQRDSATVGALLGVLDELVRGSPEQPKFGSRLSGIRGKAAAHFQHDQAPQTLEALCEKTFGSTAARAIRRGSERAMRELSAPPTAEGELIRAGSSVDGAFELGRSVAPVRVLEEQRRMAAVAFPTQNMVLLLARNVSDLPSSVISDPRLLLHDLASQTLLARRYLAQRKRKAASFLRYTEARYYLLDGSSSMAGRRARMRDAIVISELGTMIRHLEHGSASARPVVYYRHFAKTCEPLIKAWTIEEASSSIEALLVRKSRGETDIEGALLQCFDDIARERQGDATLKRAQLVLVTDGVADIDIERVWAARERLGDMKVQVSVIALGSENPALKQLAALQRARGEAVFYHHLSDEALYHLGRGARTGDVRGIHARAPSLPAEAPHPPLLAPEIEPSAAPQIEPNDEAIWTELGMLVDELSVLRAEPDLDRLAQAEHLETAYAELGLSLSDIGLEAERADCEAQRRDLRALCARFDHWFPELPKLPAARDESTPAELLSVIEVVLTTVAELIGYLDGQPLQRRVDAIEILERLLIEAGVSPWAYRRALPNASANARIAVERLRNLVSARDPA